MLKQLFKNFILKGTDWLFRVTKIEYYLLSLSMALIFIVFKPQFIGMVLSFISPEWYQKYESTEKNLEIAKYIVLGIAIVFMGIALYILVTRYCDERRLKSKKLLFVIEGRGLQADDGASLGETVRETNSGQIIQISLDLRNGIGGVNNPEQGIKSIQATHFSLEQHKKSYAKTDITVFYGGLTSVPYTFLTGVLLDDEGVVVPYDWDREKEVWRLLDEEDDGNEFDIEGLSLIENSDTVVVALAFSYPILEDDLVSTFTDPIVRLSFKGGFSSSAHWSQVKQSRLAQQFFEVIKQLSASGVTRIHLVMAAPNSVVFNFGRRYDRRNLPEVIVYQFERGQNPTYPWGVRMPVNGLTDAELVVPNQNKI